MALQAACSRIKTKDYKHTLTQSTAAASQTNDLSKPVPPIMNGYSTWGALRTAMLMTALKGVKS